MTYVADYFTKDDTGLTQVLQKAINESKYTNDFDRLNYLKQVFFTHRQVCVCEAAYRLISGLNLKGSNVQCFFVQTGFPQNRTTFLKKICEEDDEDEDDEQENDAGNSSMGCHSKTAQDGITMPGRKGSYTMTQSIHQKYESRPKVLNKMCLAQFALYYDTLSGTPPKKIEFIDNASTNVSLTKIFGTDIQLPSFIKLNDEKGNTMKLRSSPKILRLHKKKMSHEQLYSDLLLFLPYRDESTELFVDANECTELYERSKALINQNKKSIFPYSEDIDLVNMIMESDEKKKAQDDL